MLSSHHPTKNNTVKFCYFSRNMRPLKTFFLNAHHLNVTAFLMKGLDLAQNLKAESCH